MLPTVLFALSLSVVWDDEIEKPFEWLKVPPDVPKRGERYVGEFGAAQLEARARNCPILVIVAEDHNPGFITSDRTLLTNSMFASLTRRCVTVPAVGGTSLPRVTRKVNGVKVPWCKRFDLPLQLRQQAYVELLDRYVQREYWQPMFLFLEPDGEEWTRTEGHKLTPGDIEERLEELQERLGKDLSYTTYRSAVQEARKLVDARERRGRGKALDLLVRLRKGWTTPGLLEFAQRIESEMLAEGERAVRAAQKLAESGEVAEAIERLVALEREWPKREPGRLAGNLRRHLEGSG